MNKMFHLFILIILISITFCHNERKSFKELIDIYLNKLDINNAYLSYEQYISLLKSLQNDFSDYLDIYTIGKTYEGNDMPLIVMKSPLISKQSINNEQKNTFKEMLIVNNATINNISKNDTNETFKYLIDSSLYNKSGIFFTGMHHGREPVSMMMNIYLILHILSLPKFYIHLFLSSTNLYFLPIINIDAYKYNCIKYSKTNLTRLMQTRKNRHRFNNTLCSNESLGVDLNRNYPFFNDIIKSFKFRPCGQEYMGEYPFSEPETRNIKNFIDTHPDIKIVFNYHGYGNLYITPFNYLSKNNSEILFKKNYSLFYSIYQEFQKEANFPINSTFGNAIVTIGYKAFGEATDWYLTEKKILSFSPELGNEDKNSETYYPNRSITFDILKKNLKPALYAIEKSMFYLKAELLKAEYYNCIYSSKIEEIYLYKNRRVIYDNDNLKNMEINNCFSDEIILSMKLRITNRGFGIYHPGLEFNYNILNDVNGDNITEVENKKYFYFLAFDIKINLDKIKSICYWSYKEENINFKKINETNSNNNNFKIRCSSNKEDNLREDKIFIDNQINPFESYILNVQFITKKENFLYKKNNNNTIINNDNNTNNKTVYKFNDTNDVVHILTKKDRMIKSQDIDGENIYWKFNSPFICIKFNDFIASKKKNLRIISHNPYRFFTFTFFSMGIMIFFLFRLIKLMNMRIFQEQEDEQIVGNNLGNERRALNRRNLYVVDNYENINRFRGENRVNNNLEENQGYQIPREDSESFSNSNSNSDSP